ncbi:MAG: hypothetical protein IPK75_20170 [Acidobacteria bacterium]|nr:hypothetical protein [Acidobacteriota bacterium]
MIQPDIVLAHLVAAAVAGKPCPTNTEIAAAAGLTRSSVATIIWRLGKSGAIVVRRPGGPNDAARIIEIVASGLTIQSARKVAPENACWMSLPWPAVSKPASTPDYSPHNVDPGDGARRFFAPPSHVQTVNVIYMVG